MKRVLAGLALLTLGIAPSAAVSAAPTHGALHVPRSSTGDPSSSLGWSGYEVLGSDAAHVIGSWTQPAATCSPGETSWSSPWVGIDGDTSNTVEQIGTDTDCSKGQPYYYAWYEMYPKNTAVISSSLIRVQPGDSFTGEVTYQGNGNFLLTLTNNTTGQTFSTTQYRKNVGLASVEAIMEGPYSSGLTDFGSVTFTGVSATINGSTGNLGLLSPLYPVTMVSRKGLTRASPGRMSRDGSSFSVSWAQS